MRTSNEYRFALGAAEWSKGGCAAHALEKKAWARCEGLYRRCANHVAHGRRSGSQRKTQTKQPAGCGNTRQIGAGFEQEVWSIVDGTSEIANVRFVTILATQGTRTRL
jgi:hypothetical protein